MAHGDPKHPKKNPHPVQRYEVIATADAPGPWDSVHGYISYEVVNPDCTPKDKFLGVNELPQDVGVDIEMTRVDSKTWKGYFFRDAILDEDYYGLGICHWEATNVSANFTAHKAVFGAGDILNVLLQKGPQTEYFKKNDYGNPAIAVYGAQAYSSADPNVTKHLDAFFSVTVAIKEDKP